MIWITAIASASSVATPTPGWTDWFWSWLGEAPAPEPEVLRCKGPPPLPPPLVLDGTVELRVADGAILEIGCRNGDYRHRFTAVDGRIVAPLPTDPTIRCAAVWKGLPASDPFPVEAGQSWTCAGDPAVSRCAR